MSGDVTIDLSEIDALVKVLEAAAERPKKEQGRIVREAGSQLRAAAITNAASWSKASTGATASGVSMQMVGTGRVRVSVDTRGGFFKEMGSPHTGAPDPWMTRPAEEAAQKLLEALGKTGDIL